MKTELYFRLGEVEGFTSIKLADKQQGWATPIRELLQNSLDASDGIKKCKINIYIETIKTPDIPHIEEYKRVLEKAIRTQKDKNSYNDNAKQQVEFMRNALKKDELDVLMFVDNGSGMPPEKLNGLLDERSVDKDASSAGSFGVGHLSSYSLSSLRYILYATKYKSGNDIKNLFTGQPILAGHEDAAADRSGKGRILKCTPRDEKKPEFVFPDQFPTFIQSKMNEVKETGTLIAILGLSEEWDDDAKYAMVSNYFHAIVHDGLSITINGQTDEISADKVEQLIVSKKDEKNKKGDSILSGRAIYQAWQTVLARGSQKTITLKNSDKVHVCIKADAEFDSTIVLIRNGMVIARHDGMLSPALNGLRKNSNFEPFTAVIDVNNEHSPKLFALVKGAENPHHNKLQAKLLSDSNEKKLKKLFEELSDGIEKYLSEIKRDSHALPLFMTSAENTEAQAASGIARGQSLSASRQTPNKKKKEKKKKQKKSTKKKGRQAPEVTSRSLESKNATRYEDKGDKWKVHLRITPKDYVHSKDDVYFSIYLGEDHDQDSADTYLEFVNVSTNEKPEKIINGTQVKLTGLKQGERYNIIAEVKKPSKIGDMKVSLLPFLSLKKKTKSDSATTESEE